MRFRNGVVVATSDPYTSGKARSGAGGEHLSSRSTCSSGGGSYVVTRGTDPALAAVPQNSLSSLSLG